MIVSSSVAGAHRHNLKAMTARVEAPQSPARAIPQTRPSAGPASQLGTPALDHVKEISARSSLGIPPVQALFDAYKTPRAHTMPKLVDAILQVAPPGA